MEEEDAARGFDHVKGDSTTATRLTSFLYGLDSTTPICYTLTPANRHNNTRTRPLIKRLGARIFKVNAIPADKSYDNKGNIENYGMAGVLFIAARNKRDTKKPVNKYRVQDYLEPAEEKIDQLYKNRMDCEHANFLLKGQPGLSDFCYAIRAKTTGQKKSR